MAMFESSNPALGRSGAFNVYAGDQQTATLQGIANKTAMLLGIAMLGGLAGCWLVGKIGGSAVMVSSIAALIVTFGVYFFISRNPEAAAKAAPIYAFVEGIFLGALTLLLENILTRQGIAVPGGIALQAFVVTLGIMAAMLILYKMKLLRPTARFKSMLSTITGGIMIIYMISFGLSLFGMQMPFLSLGSAFQGGTPALIGLGLNGFILIIASLWLITDFKLIEDKVRQGASVKMEWYCAFALMVTLAWIYYEAVKMVFRLALLLNSRD